MCRPRSVHRTNSVPGTEKARGTELQRSQKQKKLKQVYMPKSSLRSASTHGSTERYHAVPYIYGVDEAYSISMRERQEGIPKGN